MNKFVNIAILVLLGVFISFRINVACNELSKNKSSGDTFSALIDIPSTYHGTFNCTTCPETHIELSLNHDIYSETRQFSTRDFMPYTGMGKWQISGDTLTTYKDSGLTNLTFLIRPDSLYWLQNGRKVRQPGSNNWNYLLLKENPLSDL